MVAFFLLSPIKGQNRSEWRIVEKLATKANTPDAPVLNAVFFTDDSNGWTVGDDGILASTNDAGQTWKVSLVNPSANFNGIFFSTARKGFAVGDFERNGIIISTNDGGITWSKQYRLEGFELSTLTDISFVDQKHGWATGEAQLNGRVKGVIIATKDGGVHWHLQYLSPRKDSGLRSVEFIDTQRGWAVGDSFVLHTENGGQQWKAQLKEPGHYYFDVDFINSSEGWIAGSQGLLLHTTDGGKRWERRQPPSEQRTLWLTSVKFVSPILGWIAGDNGKILSTNDGGQTWGLETSGTTEVLRGIVSTSSCIFAVGNKGIILQRKL